MRSEGMPRLLFITGPDGCGKTHLAKMLRTAFTLRGYRTAVVWSRFFNFFSKPFLAITRLTGHNYYHMADGVKFGFHDFQGLGWLRWLFTALQAIDVNIGTYFAIYRKRKFDLLVCERGPWDTLSDVMVDTNLRISPQSLVGRIFVLQARKAGKVILIKRSRANIIATRPELKHDVKLRQKIASYDYLAAVENWSVVENNGSLRQVELAVRQLVGLHRIS
jgi:hypothetical protein